MHLISLFLQDESLRVEFLAKISNKCSSDKQKSRCESEFIFENATYEQTGEYSCYYEEKKESKIGESVYFFVNGK